MDRDVSSLKTRTKIILVVIAVVLLVGCCVGAFLLGKNFTDSKDVEQKETDKKEGKESPETEDEYKADEFVLDSNKKFIITTNSKYMTLQNDGGSYTSIYYQVDLDKRVAYKLQDKYVGFKGFEYKGRVVNKQEIYEEEVLIIQGLVDKIIKENGQVPEEEAYKFYTLETRDNKEVKITNKDYQLELIDLLE